MYFKGFPSGSDGKESACNAGDLGSIPWSRRFPGEGNSNPLQYSCLGSPMDRGAWWATVHEVPKQSHLTQRLHNNNNNSAYHLQQVVRMSGFKAAVYLLFQERDHMPSSGISALLVKLPLWFLSAQLSSDAGRMSTSSRCCSVISSSLLNPIFQPVSKHL